MNYRNGAVVGAGGRVLQGPEATIAAQALMRERDQHQNWPYNHVYPPPGAIRVMVGADASGTLVTPAVATPTQALLYTVEQGFDFWLTHLVVNYINQNTGNTAVAPGAFTWSLTTNQPVGTTPFQGSFVQGLKNVDVPLGSLVIPWAIGYPTGMPEKFEPADQIRIVVTNVTLAVGGANWIKSILIGWRVPASGD